MKSSGATLKQLRPPSSSGVLRVGGLFASSRGMRRIQAVPKKLPERFNRVEAACREDYTCEKCEKIRAICRECNNCQECCQCEYCELCGEPDGYSLNATCTCFRCDDCHQKFTENDMVVDDGDYEHPETHNPWLPFQYVCTKCFKKREKAIVISPTQWLQGQALFIFQQIH